MDASVIVCSGCCCGNLGKGYDEVPVYDLKSAWEKDAPTNVELTISGCLGVCGMRNVVVLQTERGETWLGGLSTREEYDLIVEWAHKFSSGQVDTTFPKELESLIFESLRPVNIRKPRLHAPTQISQGVAN